ncbi:hypothetical protein K3495_g14219 [Podosphaera aphanis]|nr:hypothetical protein K3495_g14219 [Podosphaera aphanis]
MTYLLSDLNLYVSISPTIKAFCQPTQNFLATRNIRGYDFICTGAFIFDRQGRLLIVQRAASNTFPGCWEIPGGGYDSTDTTILDGMAREVLEETGLRVTAIRRVIDRDGRMIIRRNGKRILKFEFEVEVCCTDFVKVNPPEHQAYRWSTEEECRKEIIDLGTDVRLKFASADRLASILNAFSKRRENRT